MTIEWLAGNRIRGTSTERTTTTGFNPVAGVAGGWVELGRTTLGSAGTTITVSGLADKRYYKILTSSTGSGSPDYTVRINSDTGSTYASRWMDNGSGENTGVSRTSMLYDSVGGAFNHKFNVGYIANLASKEKLSINHSVDSDTSAASTAPSRSETVSKWSNTSDALSEFSLISTVNMDIGSEVVVLGWDDSDTHSTNFWEELGTDTWTSGDSISVSFTAKKYIMFSWWLKHNGSAGGATSGYVGNTTIDTGSNYANRLSENGAADYLTTSQGKFTYMGGEGTGGAGQTNFGYGFAINNASNEKLFTWHQVENQDAGAANAPKYRGESVGKWANTSNQFDIMTLTRVTNDLAGGELRVWGSN